MTESELVELEERLKQIDGTDGAWAIDICEEYVPPLIAEVRALREMKNNIDAFLAEAYRRAWESDSHRQFANTIEGALAEFGLTFSADDQIEYKPKDTTR